MPTTRLESLSDEQLMMEYRGACEAADEVRADDAFALLYDRLAARLHGYVCRRVGRGEHTEEIVQEVFVALHELAPKYEPTARLSTLAFRIACYRCGSYLERMKYRRHASLDAPRLASRGGEAAPMVEGVADERARAQDATAALAAMCALLRALLDELPERDARVFWSYYHEGRTASEISDDLDLPVGTVRSAIRRTVARARERLAHDWAAYMDRSEATNQGARR